MPGKPLDVATHRLVYTKGETVEEHLTSAVWLISPHLPSCSTPLQHLKGTRQERVLKDRHKALAVPQKSTSIFSSLHTLYYFAADVGPH